MWLCLLTLNGLDLLNMAHISEQLSGSSYNYMHNNCWRQSLMWLKVSHIFPSLSKKHEWAMPGLFVVVLSETLTSLFLMTSYFSRVLHCAGAGCHNRETLKGSECICCRNSVCWRGGFKNTVKPKNIKLSFFPHLRVAAKQWLLLA